MGTTFTVTENAADQNGYETTAALNGTVEADKVVEGTISATEAMTASYTNTRETTTYSASKVWKSGTQTVTWPEDVESVDFTLYKTLNGVKSIVTAADLTDNGIDAAGFTNPATLTGDPVTAAWNDLPAKYLVSGTWYEAEYSAEETKVTYTDASGKATLETAEAIKAAYAPTTEGTNIENNIPKIPAEVTKTWGDGQQPPEGAVIKVRLTATANDTEIDETDLKALTGLTDLEVTLDGDLTTAGDTETAWYYQWTELPKYDNAGHLISYGVTETQYTIGGVDYTDELPGSVSGGDNALVVTNDIPTVDKRAKKSWGQNKLPEDTSVTLKITATVSGSEDDIFDTLGLSVDQEQVLDGSESTAWEATWPDLPMYDVDGRTITYTIEETEYTVDGKTCEGVSIDEVIAENYDASFTNPLPTTEVTVNKTWDGADTWRNEDISVLMTLMSNGGIAEDLPSYIPTDEPGATAVEQTATVELTAAERSRTWHDLPMYDSDGELITYTVVETGVKYGDHELTNVFAVTGEGEPDDEGEVTIDNANETEIEVTKVWKLNDRDRTDKESITFEVYRKVGEAEPVKLDKVYASVDEADPSETEGSEVTVQYEDGAWQIVKISGLPRYELVIDSDAGTAAYVPVSYFVEETGADERTHVTYEAAQPDDEPTTETGSATETGPDTTDNEKADPEEAAVNSGRITICNRDYEVAVNVLKVRSPASA